MDADVAAVSRNAEAVNGSIASSSGLTVNAGGTIGGNGALPKTTINGGTLSPGNSVGTITINGSLVLTAATSYIVEVTNGDSVEHNFTFQQAGASQDIEGGEDAKVTFTAPAAGSYDFHCKYHPSAMKGTVTVT